MSIYLLFIPFHSIIVLFFQNFIHFSYVLTLSVVSLMFMENGKSYCFFLSLRPFPRDIA